MKDFAIVLTTFPADRDPAPLARTLVEERLAACVNVLPVMTSIYRWQGAVETADDVLADVDEPATGLEREETALIEASPATATPAAEEPPAESVPAAESVSAAEAAAAAEPATVVEPVSAPEPVEADDKPAPATPPLAPAVVEAPPPAPARSAATSPPGGDRRRHARRDCCSPRAPARERSPATARRPARPRRS